MTTQMPTFEDMVSGRRRGSGRWKSQLEGLEVGDVIDMELDDTDADSSRRAVWTAAGALHIAIATRVMEGHLYVARVE